MTSEYPKDPTDEQEALQTLAAFARTAPGCLPGRVLKALEIADAANLEKDGFTGREIRQTRKQELP